MCSLRTSLNFSPYCTFPDNSGLSMIFTFALTRVARLICCLFSTSLKTSAPIYIGRSLTNFCSSMIDPHVVNRINVFFASDRSDSVSRNWQSYCVRNTNIAWCPTRKCGRVSYHITTFIDSTIKLLADNWVIYSEITKPMAMSFVNMFFTKLGHVLLVPKEN